MKPFHFILILMTFLTACSVPQIQPLPSTRTKIQTTASTAVTMHMYKYTGTNPLSHSDQWQKILTLHPGHHNDLDIRLAPGETFIVMAHTEYGSNPESFVLESKVKDNTLFSVVSSYRKDEKGPASREYEVAIGYHTF